MISAVASSRALLLQRGSLLLHPAARACVVGGSAVASSAVSESRHGVATSAAAASSVSPMRLGAGSSWSSSGASSPFLSGAAAAAAALAATGAAAAAVHAEAPSAAGPPPEAGGSGEYVLYQYTVCPFCCKTKAVMDYYNVPYRTVEVNPLTKSEIKWSDYKKVPVLVMDGEQYNDSNVISEEIKAKFGSEDDAKSGGNWFRHMFKGQAATAEQDEEEAKWRKWVDEWFVRVITTNIYRTWGESVGTFDYISEHALDFGLVERLSSRYVGATAMYYIAKNMKKKYSIEGDDRTHLYTAVGDFLEAVGDRDFMGGDKPELSDLYVFGVLRAVQGTDTFKDVMANTDIQDWYVRMTEAVGASVAAPTAAASA